MANLGGDASEVVTATAGDLVKLGWSFVGRYYGGSKAKDLTPEEAAHLSKMGLWIVTVFEGAGDKPSSFDRNHADRDCGNAFNQALACKQTHGSGLYFAVDFDCDMATCHSRIVPYYEEVNKNIQRDGNPYEPAVYGNGLICRELKRLGLVTRTWLAMSGGWRGSKDYHDWNIHQHGVKIVDGIQFDCDISNGNGGGWKI